MQVHPLPQLSWRRLTRRGVRPLALTSALVLGGCEARTPTFLERQALDRPTDMALVCAHLKCDPPGENNDVDPSSCQTLLDPMSFCKTPALTDCSFNINEAGVSRTQLFGFATSSGRNELALVSRCEGRVLDSQMSLPGLNALPVGDMPTKVAASQDGCRVATVNVGSCDFSVVQTEHVVRQGLGIQDVSADDEAQVVQSLTPKALDPATGEFSALPVSAVDLQMVPPSVLGQSVASQVCDDTRDYRAYALFPSCDLLAEIDLRNGHILQSLQWQKSGDAITVVDTGQSPVCPVYDCASAQALPQNAPPLAGLSLRSLSLVDDYGEGASVGAALYVGGLDHGSVYEVRVQASDARFVPEPRSVELFGDPGVSKIRVSPRFAPNGGVQTATVDCAQLPTDTNPEGSTRFAYVIANDGSTRVLQLDAFAGGSQMGQECNTQKDPVALEAEGQSRCLCVPVVADAPDSESSAADPNAFRWLADGPGIRSPDPTERAVDWAFVPALSSRGEGLVQPEPLPDDPFENYGFKGMMSAVGMSSQGAFMMTSFGQYQRRLDFPGAGLGSVNHLEERAVRRVSTSGTQDEPDLGDEWRPILDRFATLRFGLAPHALHSLRALSPVLVQDGEVLPRGIALVADSPMQVSGLVRADAIAALSPAIRAIDIAYADTSPQVAGIGSAGSPMVSFLLDDQGQGAKVADGLGKDDRGQWGFYNDAAARIVTRDYRSWPAADMQLSWEGVVGQARSVQGRIECSNPTADQTQCQGQGGEVLRLADDSIDFCQQGVLAGDTLRLRTCRDDNECGTEQACLKRSSNANEQPGICVSALALQSEQDALREACAPFLYNPCGEPLLEYEITQAKAHRLSLQTMPIAPMAHWTSGDSCPAGGRNNHLQAGVCVCDPGLVPCGEPLLVDQDGKVLALDCGRPGTEPGTCVDEGREENLGHEVVDQFVCNEDQPDGGCSVDPDCDDLRLSDQDFARLSVAGQRAATRYCIAGQCRRPCMRPEDAAALSDEDKRIIERAPGANQAALAALQGESCIRAVAPGPKCFSELLRYDVRARNAFVLTSSDARLNFFDRAVKRNEETQVCEPVAQQDASASLLSSRIPLPKTDAELEAMYPACSGSELPSLSAPFICRETALRRAGAEVRSENRFHTFAYKSLEHVVPSLRITNPVFSFNLDLTGLFGLSRRIPGQSVRWPASVVPFSRARIPQDYAVSFQIGRQGYAVNTSRPFFPRQGGNVGVPLVFPTALIQNPGAPESLFAIDSVAMGAAALGARGQILHLDVRGQDNNVVQIDLNFDQAQ